MKRNYTKPTCDIIELKITHMLASSGISYSSTNKIVDEMERKRRMEHMIDAGANVTEYPIGKKDIFVYNRECINNRIVKKTPNTPKIGSVIQLDYNPRVGIFKHLQDDGYDYWYCKYLPNNGRDIKVTY